MPHSGLFPEKECVPCLELIIIMGRTRTRPVEHETFFCGTRVDQNNGRSLSRDKCRSGTVPPDNWNTICGTVPYLVGRSKKKSGPPLIFVMFMFQKPFGLLLWIVFGKLAL